MIQGLEKFILKLVLRFVMKIHELGHVVLYVTNLERTADFYRDVLGFKEIIRSKPIAAFSSGRTHHELLLIEIGGAPKSSHRTEPGLYHISFKIEGGHQAVQDAYRELKKANVRITGASDHGVTHSLYIVDPDGKARELYADVSDEWKKNPSAIMSPIRPLNLWESTPTEEE